MLPIRVEQDDVEVRPRPAPTAWTCLHCQLVGHRKLLCSRVDACKELPHSFALGPVLMAAWLATAIAFVVAMS